MSIQDLGSIGELIAALATVATLVYLSLQIRSNTQAVRAESRRNDVAQGTSLGAILAANKETASVFRRGMASPETLDEDEAIQFHGLFTMLLAPASNAFTEHELGIMDREYLEASTGPALQMLATPGGSAYWKAWGSSFPRDFQEFVDARRGRHAESRRTAQAPTDRMGRAGQRPSY